MFGEAWVQIFYVVQLSSLAVWFVGAWKVLVNQSKYQHAEWHHTAARLYMGYCMLELLRIADCGYTDWDTGMMYNIHGIMPWWVRLYAWVLRDVLMFRGVCVYLEHALTWSSTCLNQPVPKTLLRGQQLACLFGNLVFLFGSTLYMINNDQLWCAALCESSYASGHSLTPSFTCSITHNIPH